jgi:outer membrane receptor for ferrienterochelin and colicin
MTEYTVEYQDDIGYQKVREQNANSKRDAASKVVQEDNLSKAEAEGLKLRVYESGKPSTDKIFDAEKFL